MITDSERQSIDATYTAKICCEQLIHKLENGAPLSLAEHEHIEGLYLLEKQVSKALALARQKNLLLRRVT